MMGLIRRWGIVGGAALATLAGCEEGPAPAYNPAPPHVRETPEQPAETPEAPAEEPPADDPGTAETPEVLAADEILVAAQDDVAVVLGYEPSEAAFKGTARNGNDRGVTLTVSISTSSASVSELARFQPQAGNLEVELDLNANQERNFQVRTDGSQFGSWNANFRVETKSSGGVGGSSSTPPQNPIPQNREGPDPPAFVVYTEGNSLRVMLRSSTATRVTPMCRYSKVWHMQAKKASESWPSSSLAYVELPAGQTSHLFRGLDYITTYNVRVRTVWKPHSGARNGGGIHSPRYCNSVEDDAHGTPGYGIHDDDEWAEVQRRTALPASDHQNLRIPTSPETGWWWETNAPTGREPAPEIPMATISTIPTGAVTEAHTGSLFRVTLSKTYPITVRAAVWIKQTGGNMVGVGTGETTIPGTVPPLHSGVSVVIPPNTLTMDFLEPIDDTIDEDQAVILATLNCLKNCVVGDPRTATVTVTDDDDPNIRIYQDHTPGGVHPDGMYEGNSGTKDMPFIVEMTAAHTAEVTVKYEALNGNRAVAAYNAQSPGDFHSVSGTLTFAIGESSKTINVPIVGDTTKDHAGGHQTEEFRVRIFDATPSSVTITDSVAIGKIRDDDD